MSHTDEPDNPAQLSREIQNSEAYQIHCRLEILGIKYFMFHRNYEELKMLVVAAQHPNTFDQIWAPQKQEEMIRILCEMIRMLHNLIASAKTLVEHTRILIKEWYPDSEFLSDYDAEIQKRFVGNSIIGFIEDLRNFALHYRLPLVTARFEVNRNPDTGIFTEKQLITLDKNNLLNWSGWTTKGKIYLTDAPPSIHLEDIIDRYFNDVAAFHQWMRDRLGVLHSDELKWLDEMTRRVDEALKNRGL